MLIKALLIGSGGALGAMGRYTVSKLNKTSLFPIGTLIVNLLGAFLLGLVMGAPLNNYFKLLLGTGFLGAFTTFSTFKSENIKLILDKNHSHALIYLGLTYLCGIFLAFLGFLVDRLVF